MATPDRRLTYGGFTDKNGRTPTLEDVQDGYVMCVCGVTLQPDEFEYYVYQCEACEKRRPEVPRVLGTSEDPERPGVDTTNARHKAEQRRAPSSNVTEIPVGQYDAVRTLRHVLALAEKGAIDDVVMICTKRGEPAKPADGDDIWMTWSDMPRWSVWWYIGWAHAFIYRRYFHNDGPEEYHDEAG